MKNSVACGKILKQYITYSTSIEKEVSKTDKNGEKN